MTKQSQTASGEARKMDYQRIISPYADDLALVEEAIKANFKSDVALIPNISSYLMGSGGKRIRPLLLIISSRLCGYQGAGALHIDLSVVVEYVHAATLLHDDVVDGSSLRRGAESANVKFGNQASVLVGDFLFAKSLELMSSGGDMRIVEAMARATRNLAEGEVLQLVNTCNIDTTEEDYLNTVYRKTGALIEACLSLGAILGKATKNMENALAKYGKNIGMAFQLMDDALDYTAEEKTWGKPVGADFIEGKVTLPLIRAYSEATGDQKDFIRGCLESEEPEPSSLAEVTSILERYGAIEKTKDMAKDYVEEAKASLSALPLSDDLGALFSVADYVIERKV